MTKRTSNRVPVAKERAENVSREVTPDEADDLRAEFRFAAAGVLWCACAAAVVLAFGDEATGYAPTGPDPTHQDRYCAPTTWQVVAARGGAAGRAT